MKKLFAIILTVAMVVCFAACGGETAKAPAKLTFATGGSAGTYYAYGTVLAEYVSNKTDVSVTAITGNGSKTNVEDLDAGDIQLAFCQSDVMSYAYDGTNLFDKKVDSFSVVAALYMEQVQIVTCDPSIKTVADLKGKTVSVGAQGSGTYFNAVDCLSAYDLTMNDINPKYLDFASSTEELKDNKIDAAFVVAGAPTNSITELSTSKQAYLVSIDAAHADKLIASNPYYSKNTISKDAYGLDADAETVAVAAMVLVRDDVSDDVVYTLTKTIFDGKAEIQHAKAEDLDTKFASSVTAVPFHKGAAKFYSENGITVKTK